MRGILDTSSHLYHKRWFLPTEKKNLKRVMVRNGICVSKSYYVVFYPILAPIPNFIQIGRKTQKLKTAIFLRTLNLGSKNVVLIKTRPSRPTMGPWVY